MATILTCAKVSTGVKFGDYGNEHDGGGYIGYAEPAGPGGQWIIWFCENGDADLYTEREPSGAIKGDPIKLKGYLPVEQKPAG